MTAVERYESTTTITGAAPNLIKLLRQAAALAAENGHTAISSDHVLCVLLEESPSLLEVHWPREGRPPVEKGKDYDPQAPQRALTLDDVRALVRSHISPPVGSTDHHPARPATVTYELSGSDSDEFRRHIEG